MILRPRISVCMAVYNGEPYIEEQIKSILCQLEDNDEIVVVDDVSTDRSIEKIQMFEDSRIKVILNHENLGHVKTFEKAIVRANGEVIFLADQDDLWKRDKVDKMLLELYQKEADMVISNATIVDSDLKIIEPSYFDYRKTTTNILANMYKQRYLACCMAFRADCKKWILPFPKGVFSHDSWIGINITYTGKAILVDEPLMFWRRHSNTVTPKHRHSLWKVGQLRIVLLWIFLKRLPKLVKHKFKRWD